LKYWSSANRQYKYYPDRLKKNFTQKAPNLVWVSDVTYVKVNDACLPDTANTGFYEQGHRLYQSLYLGLKDSYKTLTALREKKG